MILNFTEVLFWAVLMGLVFSASARFCIGASCAVTLVIGVLCVVLLYVPPSPPPEQPNVSKLC